jgi:hypothetical protein
VRKHRLIGAALLAVALGVVTVALLLSHRTVALEASIEESCEYPAGYHPVPGTFDDSMCTNRTTRAVPASTFVCAPAVHLAWSDFDAEGSDQGKCRPNAMRRALAATATGGTALLLLVASVVTLARSSGRLVPDEL